MSEEKEKTRWLTIDGHRTRIGPPPGGYRLQGHTTFQGLRVAIENRKGSVRAGVDKDGKPWRTKMQHPYGYIVGSKGADGEEIDVYVGPDKDADKVYVVHQNKIDGKTYDEDKVMLGFSSKEEARQAYLAHYNEKGKKLLGAITSMDVARLKKQLRSGEKLAAVRFDAFLRELSQAARYHTA